jgi:hypothetical protein
MSYKTFERPPKTAGERLKENLTFMFVAMITLSIFDWIFEIIMKPLRDPILGPAELKAKAERLAEQKKQARTEYYERISLDENDPMNQFQLRFLTDVEEYKGKLVVSINKTYKAWYETWRAGIILDSGLRWAPEIILENGNYNSCFIKYMKIQLDLHKHASFLKRILFCNTLNRYYPELSPNLRGLERDLAIMNAKAEEGKLKGELKETISAYGLSEELAEYIVENDSKDIKGVAEKLKEFSNHGLRPRTCICAIENKLTLEEAQVINTIATEFDLPTKVGLAILRKEIAMDDLIELVESMHFACDQHGSDIHTHRDGEDFTLYDELLDEYLKKFKARKRLVNFK